MSDNLARIAMCLEAICRHNSIPLEVPTVPEFKPVNYTMDERTQIVAEAKARK